MYIGYSEIHIAPVIVALLTVRYLTHTHTCTCEGLFIISFINAIVNQNDADQDEERAAANDDDTSCSGGEIVVARGYQILFWATRKKSSCSPLGYQTLWLYGRENLQSHLQQSLAVLPSSASLPN